MKLRYLHRILSCLVVALIAVSCVEPLVKPDGEEDGLYTIQFRIKTEDDAYRTKAGPISGNDVPVSKLFMYCFDASGRYLGRFQATGLTSEYGTPTAGQTSNPEPDGNTQPEGTFKGQIPPATARIHFVANADKQVGGDKIGLTEEQIMHDPDLMYLTKDDPMSYWGYLRRATPESMASLFVAGDPTTTVWLVRDRLWIEAGSYRTDLFYDDIQWVVYNGLNRCFIAPYSLSPEDDTHDEDWLDPANPYQELRYTRTETGTPVFALSSYLTPYPESNPVSAGRFTTSKSDMVPFDKSKTGYQPMYVFDDLCPATNTARVVKIIVKVRFKATGNTKYFPICITHDYSDEPIPLRRGHRYKLDLQNLPEAYGYDEFDDAAAATSFANGALVDIPDKVIEVSDGRFNLQVNYPLYYPLAQETNASTSILIQDPSVTQVTVDFSLTKQQGTYDDKTFNFGESAWLESLLGAIPAHTGTSVSWGSGISNNEATIGSPLKSSFSFPLNTVSDNLRQSTFNLKAYYTSTLTDAEGTHEVKHILMRNVEVYTITQFKIQEAYTSSTENHNAAGNLVLVPNGGGYRLKFKLPGGSSETGDHDKYPELLYPMQIKFATTTLKPTKAYIAGAEQPNVTFGVQVRSTAPGKAPSNISGWGTSGNWNYQESSKPWNFWYTYTITSVPRTTSGEEIIGPEIWIDFEDVRNSGAFATRPSNVGLYFYIEFFGSAIPISYTP